jgi:hypothetical protein
MLSYHNTLQTSIEQHESAVHWKMHHHSVQDGLSNKTADVSCDKVHHMEKMETIDSRSLVDELKIKIIKFY